MGYSKNAVCGIYLIKNKLNNKVYIGQSISILERKNSHFKKLENNKHHSFHFQRSFNKYGKENFEFQILTICNESELNTLEEKYINEYKSDNREFGYNIILGNNKKSLESRIKLSNSLKNKPHIRAKLDRARTFRVYPKINLYDLQGNYIKTFNSTTEASLELKCSHCTLRKASTLTHGVHTVKGYQVRDYNNSIENIDPYIKHDYSLNFKRNK